MRQKLAQLWIDTEVFKYTGARAITKLLKGELPGPEASTGKMLWVEGHQRLQELAMEIQGPYAQLIEGQPSGRWTTASGSTPSSARAPTRSRAAPPRSRRTSSASACSACRKARSMNFGFNEEQELLRSTARKFFENECASEFVRDAHGRRRRA